MARNSNKKNGLIFDVALLEGDLRQVHLNLNDMSVPDIWRYAQSFYENHGELYSVNGYTFVSATGHDILHKMPFDKKEFPRLKAFVGWAAENCPKHDRIGHISFGMGLFGKQQFARFPDGTWVVEVPKVGWITIDLNSGSWQSKPQPSSINDATVKDTNYKVLLDRDERLIELVRIINGFYPSWKRSRHIYRNSLRETGELQKRIEHDRAGRDVEWMQQRMKVASAAADLRDDLADLAKHLENNTVTRARLAEVDVLIEKYTKVVTETRKNFGNRMSRKKKRRNRGE